MKVLLFGGTSEGRELAQWLGEARIPAAVCVATEYGGTLLPESVEVRVGRLDQAAMQDRMEEGFTCVVDATHPYAAEVTRTIRAAADACGLPVYRLVRDGDVDGDWLHAGDMKQAAALAADLEGNILLTTGSKELDAFAAPGLRERCCPRVLPTLDSLRRCLDLGFPTGQVICMQGPFTGALDRAVIGQYHIRVVVTKASGGAGGFWEKVEAARETGCSLIVVDRPMHEQGLTLEEIKTVLKEEQA